MAYRFNFVKKIGLFATLLLLLGSVWAMGAAGDSSAPENYRFTLTESGAVITAYLGDGFADVAVPDTLGDQPVVAIGIGAFWGNKDIRAVQLPKTVTKLESNAFADCKRLAALHAAGVTDIGDYAFFGCDSLTSLTIDDNLKSVGKESFGTAYPRISLAAGHTIDELLQLHAVLSEQSGVLLGSVGSVEVNDELLALHSSVNRMLGSSDAVNVEQLWAGDAIDVTVPDGSKTKMSFVEFTAQLHSSGLYSILDTGKQARLQLRLDAMLGALLDDARRL